MVKMLNIILFIISFCLVILSSYFITAIVKSKRHENTIVFFLLNLSAQIILSFEFLSILKAIDLYNVLKVNSAVFIFSLILWNIKSRPKFKTGEFELPFEVIKTELKKDKILYILSFFFLFSILTSLFMAVYAPVNLWDSTTYHVARVAFWIQHKSLEHFETSSIRQTMFPPNAEILYLWPLVFLKKDFFAGMVQFVSFCGSLWILSSFLSYIKVSPKRILWTVFIFASLPEIILQSSSTQNDLVLGFFLFVSLYLFIYGVREKEKTSLIMSSMALGISLGIKGSVFMFLPVIGIVYLILLIKSEKKQFYKPLLLYGSCTVLFFALLSSYNYVLNYFDFHNLLGLQSYMNFYMPPDKSIKSFIANLIRYNLCFIDFTGFPSAQILNPHFKFMKSALFWIFRLNENQGLAYVDINLLNTKIHESFGGCGPIGFLVFIPLVFRYGITGIFSRLNKRGIITLTALIPVLYIIILSGLFEFTLWNIRYFITAVVLSSPIFALSYTRRLKPLKIIVFIIAVCCFINITLKNSLRPILPVNAMSLLTTQREEVRYKTGCVLDNSFNESLRYLIKNAKNNSKIGYICSDTMWYYHFFNENPSWKIYPLRYELITKDKIKNLNYVIVCNNHQIVFNLDNSKPYTRYNKIDFKVFNDFMLVDKIGEPLSKERRFNSDELNYQFEIPEVFYIFKNKKLIQAQPFKNS